MNENVFLALLKSNEYYDVSCSTSQIRFGNLRANILISVLTNPHCEPCAKMHYRLNNLLSKTGDKYCLQYVFSSFEESLSVSNKMLIAAFFKYGSVDVMKVYDDWFTNGKYRKEEFFLQKGLLVDSIVENEFVNEIVYGVLKNKTKIDEMANTYLKDWSIDRLGKTDGAILRMGIYEMLYTDTPDVVCINEAILLAKEYSDEKVKNMIILYGLFLLAQK